MKKHPLSLLYDVKIIRQLDAHFLGTYSTLTLPACVPATVVIPANFNSIPSLGVASWISMAGFASYSATSPTSLQRLLAPHILPLLSVSA